MRPALRHPTHTGRTWTEVPQAGLLNARRSCLTLFSSVHIVSLSLMSAASTADQCGQNRGMQNTWALPETMLLKHFHLAQTESDCPGHRALSCVRSIVHCRLIRVLWAVAVVLARGSPSQAQCGPSPLKTFGDPVRVHLTACSSCLEDLCLVIAVASASSDIQMSSIVIPEVCAKAAAV